jgi:predicted DNA-binding transcriptional regulator AlpA
MPTESDPLGIALNTLVCEFAAAQAELRALRAERPTDRIEESAEAADHARSIARPLPVAFRFFDQLPDDARVDVKVVALLDGCSVATAWRRVRAGILPEPEHIGGTTRWRVGTLRAARSPSTTPVDTAKGRAERTPERGTRTKQSCPSKDKPTVTA